MILRGLLEGIVAEIRDTFSCLFIGFSFSTSGVAFALVVVWSVEYLLIGQGDMARVQVEKWDKESLRYIRFF